MAGEIRKAGGQAIAVSGDVTAEDFPGKCVKATVDAFGGIDILINNAGEFHRLILPVYTSKKYVLQRHFGVTTKHRLLGFHEGFYFFITPLFKTPFRVLTSVTEEQKC